MCVFVRRLNLLGSCFSRITLASAPVSIMARIWHPLNVMLVKFDFFVVCVSFTVVAPMTINVAISLWCVRHTEEKWFFLPQMLLNLPRARHVGLRSHFGSPQPKHRLLDVVSGC